MVPTNGSTGEWLGTQGLSMTDDTEIEWHKEQIAKKRPT
jgi:hypothetical protein